MCGIFGILAPDRREIPSSLPGNFSHGLRHRGPDHSGCFQGQGILLGMTRLAIIDLATGNQPIWNFAGDLCIVYNGELYNHPALRAELSLAGYSFSTRSDTETILAAYETWGPDCLKRFNGMFAFAIWNAKREELFLARDRLGIKPLYLAETAHGLAFSSEAKTLVPLLPGGAKADWNALASYLVMGYVPTPSAPFSGMRKLAPGHCLTVTRTDTEERGYFELAIGEAPASPFGDAVRETRERLSQAVEMEMLADVPVGVFLSGGLDSSGVAALASRGRQNLSSFALRFEEATHDESRDAALVARHLGLSHHELLFSPAMLRESLDEVSQVLDEPFGDATVLPLLALSRFAREHVKVVLTGWGGDELFAGYPTYLAHRYARLARKLPPWLRDHVLPRLAAAFPVSDAYMSLGFKAKRFVMGLDRSDILQHMAWMGYFQPQELAGLLRDEVLLQISEDPLAPIHRLAQTMTERDPVDRALRCDLRFFLEGNGLFQADRMTMAASLEARVPLLNSILMDFVAPLPATMKMPRNELKGLLRAVLAPLLPKEILNKPKKGFGPPASAWLKGIFTDKAHGLLADKDPIAGSIFRPGAVARLLHEHSTRKADHGRKLWALLSLRLWMGRFL